MPHQQDFLDSLGIGDCVGAKLRFGQGRPWPVRGHPLTFAEMISVYAYTSDDAQWGGQALNNALRGGNLGAGGGFQEYRQTLEDALAKLPAGPRWVFRRTTLPPLALNQYRPGEDVTHAGFTCASTICFAWWSQQPFRSWHGDHQFSIRSRAGKRISHYSAVSSGQEVLFEAGTRFRVTSRCDRGNNCSIFVLQEI